MAASCRWKAGPGEAGPGAGLGAGPARLKGLPAGSEVQGAAGEAAGASAAFKATDVRISTLVRKDKQGNKYSEDNRQSHKMRERS